MTTQTRRARGLVGSASDRCARRAGRLLDRGCDVGVFNRTRAKAEPFAERGATIVDAPADLGDRDIVFTMVAGSSDFEEVALGPSGIFTGGARSPRSFARRSSR
jgi:3-hydroxyisobutyrate dehydrogenase